MARLQDARRELGLGRIRASKLTGVEVPYLWKIETGKRRPGLEVSLRIARGLGLDPHSIEEFAPALEVAAANGLVPDRVELREIKPTIKPWHPKPKREVERRVAAQTQATEDK